MKAITLRKLDGTIVCFGPDNGGYDPSPVLDTVRRVEDDYDVVLQEWIAFLATLPPPPTAEEVFTQKVLAALDGLKLNPQFTQIIKDAAK